LYKVPGAGGAAASAGLAATGANLTWWFALGIAMLVAGLLLVRVARRRRAIADGGRP